MRMVLLVVLAGSVAACANDATAPRVQPAPESSLAATSGSGMMGPWGFGRRGFGMARVLFGARRLPDNLKLTDAQRTQIKSLLSSFRAAHQPELAAMQSAMREARAARLAGAAPDQRRALFATTAPQRRQLMVANKQLATQIQQVLTPEQQSWLASRRPSFTRHPAPPHRTNS